MIYLRLPVLICAVAAWAVFPCQVVTADGWGDLTGRIVIDQQDAPNHERPQHLDIPEDVQIGPDGVLADAVVFLPILDGLIPVLPMHPDLDRKERPNLRVVIEDGKMSPRVVVCNSRSTIEFVTDQNRPILINYHDGESHCSDLSNFLCAGKAIPAPTRLTSGVDPTLIGTILVRDEPYCAVTNEDGKFRISNLPAGDCTFVVWHENAERMRSDGRRFFGGYIRDLQFVDQDVVVDEIGRFHVRIEDGNTTDLGDIRLSIDQLRSVQNE